MRACEHGHGVIAGRSGSYKAKHRVLIPTGAAGAGRREELWRNRSVVPTSTQASAVSCEIFHRSSEVPVIARETGQTMFKCPESVPVRAATSLNTKMYNRYDVLAAS
eukprot:5076197-Pleurochrysis_carterae.AAC.1